MHMYQRTTLSATDMPTFAVQMSHLGNYSDFVITNTNMATDRI